MAAAGLTPLGGGAAGKRMLDAQLSGREEQFAFKRAVSGAQYGIKRAQSHKNCVVRSFVGFLVGSGPRLFLFLVGYRHTERVPYDSVVKEV